MVEDKLRQYNPFYQRHFYFGYPRLMIDFFFSVAQKDRTTFRAMDRFIIGTRIQVATFSFHEE